MIISSGLMPRKGLEMTAWRKPKKPHNYEFWKYVIESNELVEKVSNYGNERQKKELTQAIKLRNWEERQERKSYET